MDRQILPFASGDFRGEAKGLPSTSRCILGPPVVEVHLARNLRSDRLGGRRIDVGSAGAVAARFGSAVVVSVAVAAGFASAAAVYVMRSEFNPALLSAAAGSQRVRA